jgi:phosphoglycolate phosphatase
MTPVALLFDLDGTLLNTLEDLADSANLVLEAMGCPTHPVDPYRFFVGDGVEMLGRRALPQGRRSDSDVARFVELMREIYAGRQTCKTRPYDGVDEMLRGLAERGCTLTVLSNKPDGPVKSLVAALLGAHSFAVVRGALPGFPKKPDPAGAIALAAEIGLAPEQFLYLGDTATDMQTATAAGMYPVGAAWGFRGEKELRESGAAVVVHDPREVLGLVGQR